MNQVVYNNRVFYFDSQKYSVGYSNIQNNNNIQNNIITHYPNKENINNILIIPKDIKIIIKIEKKEKKKKERILAGKGYVAARGIRILNE